MTPLLGNGGLWVPAAGGGSVEPFDPAVEIAPEYWWMAEPAHCVESGGLVDTLLNIGSGGATADFTQLGAARAPLAVDGNGNSYLDLDGVADYYQTTATALWQFLCTGPWTCFIVLHRTSNPPGSQTVLDLINGSSANVGVLLAWANAINPESGTYGPFATIANGNPGVPIATVFNPAPRAPAQIEVWSIGYGGRDGPPGATQQSCDLWVRRLASTIGVSQRGTALGDAGPVSNPLSLGRQTTVATQFCGSRIYEILIVPRLLSDRLVFGYEDYARLKYEIAI